MCGNFQGKFLEEGVYVTNYMYVGDGVREGKRDREKIYLYSRRTR
jgi:hypothetical protein